MVKLNSTLSCELISRPRPGAADPFRDNRGLGELISRPIVGMDAPGTMGHWVSSSHVPGWAEAFELHELLADLTSEGQ